MLSAPWVQLHCARSAVLMVRGIEKVGYLSTQVCNSYVHSHTRMSPHVQGQRWSQLRTVVQPTDRHHIWTWPPSLRRVGWRWGGGGGAMSRGMCQAGPPVKAVPPRHCMLLQFAVCIYNEQSWSPLAWSGFCLSV